MAISPISGIPNGGVPVRAGIENQSANQTQAANSTDARGGQVTGAATSQGTVETRASAAIAAPQAAEAADASIQARSNGQNMMTEPSRADAQSVIEAVAAEERVDIAEAELEDARAEAESYQAEARKQQVLDMVSAPVQVDALDPVTQGGTESVDSDPFADPPSKADAA